MMYLVRTLTLSLFFLFSSLAWGVNINTADASMLASELKGVGERRAQAIVEYRKQHGPFKSVDDLVNVKGVGPAVLKKNRSKLSISDSAK